METVQLVSLLRRLSRAGVNRVPKKRKEASALLALSLVQLDPDGIYDEAEIDQHLIKWLGALSGQAGTVDHVTWRRTLVDLWFLRRATDGAIYRIRAETIDEALTKDAQQVDPVVVFADAAVAQQQRQADYHNTGG